MIELTSEELAAAIQSRLARAQRQLDDAQYGLMQLELRRAIALAKAAQTAPADADCDGDMPA